MYGLNQKHVGVVKIYLYIYIYIYIYIYTHTHTEVPTADTVSLAVKRSAEHQQDAGNYLGGAVAHSGSQLSNSHQGRHKVLNMEEQRG